MSKEINTKRRHRGFVHPLLLISIICGLLVTYMLIYVASSFVRDIPAKINELSHSYFANANIDDNGKIGYLRKYVIQCVEKRSRDRKGVYFARASLVIDNEFDLDVVSRLYTLECISEREGSVLSQKEILDLIELRSRLSI